LQPRFQRFALKRNYAERLLASVSVGGQVSLFGPANLLFIQSLGEFRNQLSGPNYVKRSQSLRLKVSGEYALKFYPARIFCSGI